ncbi:MAG: hypothetical protein KIT17_14020 [Rubrivivax sp.]|nr:hypothetical protein [Rubrivivax sp.]
MPPSTAAVATTVVIYAKDKDRVAEFYRRTLDLAVSEWEDGFSILTGAQVEVRVVRMPVAVASQVVITSPPERREHMPVKASFLVGSFAAVREAAEATGGGLEPAEAEWTWHGTVHLDGFDPEGNVVQFRRRA